MRKVRGGAALIWPSTWPASRPVMAANFRAVAPALARLPGHTPSTYTGARTCSALPFASSTGARSGNWVITASLSPGPRCGLMTLGAHTTFQVPPTLRIPNLPL